MSEPTAPPAFLVTPKMQRFPAALVGIGALALAIGLVVAPERTWLNLLVDGFYVLSLGVAALFFITTQRLSSAHWSAAIRRIPEAISRVLPAGAVLMAILAFGYHALYPWTSPHEVVAEPGGVIAGRHTYLAPAFVYTRMIVIVGLWLLFAWRFRKTSADADHSRDAGLAGHVKLNRLAALFAPLFALSFTAAAYDWLVSLDPTWFSTMFAVYVFAGSFVQGIAVIALTLVVLKQRGAFGAADSIVGGEPVHTLGTMLLAFSTFWAYIWTCQYLLIWYGNIPEEVTYYLARSSPPWLPLFLGSFVVSWIVPFFTLLPRGSKRSLAVMKAMCIVVLAGRWLDLYIMVMPSKWDAPHFGPLELAMAAGTGGLIYLIIVRGLARLPLIPRHEPVIEARRVHAEGAAS